MTRRYDYIKGAGKGRARGGGELKAQPAWQETGTVLYDGSVSKTEHPVTKKLVSSRRDS